MQMHCNCIAKAIHMLIVCSANAMQNYANKNKIKKKDKYKRKNILTDLL